MSRLTPVLDADLHAYVDNQADALLRARVQTHLTANIDAARRVAGWSAQNEALREAFPLPLPNKINISAAPKRETTADHVIYVLSLVLAFLVGVAVTITIYACSSMLASSPAVHSLLSYAMFLRG